MNAQHTPGPWLDNLHHEKRDGGRFFTHITAEGLVPVACVVTGVEGYGSDEGRANARLIAAAPELLAELRDLVDWLHDNQRTIDGEFSMDDLLTAPRAAIAKATSSDGVAL